MAAEPAALEAARLEVQQASRPSTTWTGPTTGPTAAPGRVVAVLAEDLRNGGVLSVAQGIREAAREIGWTVRVLDAGGQAAGRQRALDEALSAKPDGVVLCGSDAFELLAASRGRADKLPPMVGWHAASNAGPIHGTPVATNVTTDPVAVARITALAALVQSEGRAGVVIFTDSRFRIATTKSDAMADVVRQCRNCQLLEVRDVPISDSASRMPAIVRELFTRHGRRWTHALAINDIYFDYAVPTLMSLGVPNSSISLLSAGDGSAPAFLRIRAGSYQTGTVAEPLNQQGWQVIDELNRLMNGLAPSGFTAPVHLVTQANIAMEGGSRQVYDPVNGYRDAYLRIWKGR
ncbi:substrate-binding domain-containing protein [Ideonella sp. DXS29W]|uniref:Substrate-binding domain-containing protein n=1 Tax=Ideonella lacteola TaxID=2984193 RepID=A0ABU9BRW5_9BURK